MVFIWCDGLDYFFFFQVARWHPNNQRIFCMITIFNAISSTHFIRKVLSKQGKKKQNKHASFHLINANYKLDKCKWVSYKRMYICVFKVWFWNTMRTFSQCLHKCITHVELSFFAYLTWFLVAQNFRLNFE